MSIRTFLDLQVQFGLENSLDDSLFERTVDQLLDTLDHATAGVLTLTALSTNTVLPFGDVLEGRIVYIEAENGDIRFTLGGGLATAGMLDAVGAIYPTGFVGAETLDFEVDGTLINVVFLVGDQTLTQVINRINSFCALAGFSTPIAQPTVGQLRLKSPTTGTTSTIEIIGGTARAPLGLPVPGTTGTGANATPGTSPIELRRPANPAGASAAAGVRAVFYATVKTSSITVDNLSNNDTKVRFAIAGDISTDGAC
jgi:hypothetical protein